jgi:hypothetical protein
MKNLLVKGGRGGGCGEGVLAPPRGGATLHSESQPDFKTKTFVVLAPPRGGARRGRREGSVAPPLGGASTPSYSHQLKEGDDKAKLHLT